MPRLNLNYFRRRYGHIFVEQEGIQALARYLLLAALFFAPWAYGGTRHEVVDFLDDSLFVCFGLHLLGLVTARRLPRYPLIPTVCFLLLIVESSWMCFNARSYLDDSFWEFVPVDQPCPGLPGTWEKSDSLFRLKTLCAMTAAFLVAADLVSNLVWKKRLWRAMAIAGTSIIVYGLLVKVFGPDSALSMYRDSSTSMTEDSKVIVSFFGPYFYHANAGAYLNLVWPVLLALFVQSWRVSDAYVSRTVWLCLFVTGIAACFVNTSKASGAISALMLVASVFVFAGFFRTNLARSRIASRVLVGVFILGFIGILIYGGIASQLMLRWNDLLKTGDSDDANARFLVDGACLRMIPQAGWFGYGPGTFSAVFPFHTLYLGDRIQGFWVYAHQDYLQTVIEFGYIGAVIWSVFFFGGILKAILRALKSDLRTNDLVTYRAVVIALGGVALHSMADFPLQIASIQLYVMMLLAYAWNMTAEIRTRPRKVEA